MPLKKQTFNADEIEIYDEAVVYKRGEYWQMRMWLGKEKKYARFSLRTRNRDTAIDKAKKYYHELMAQQLAGKTYFSKTTKQGVEEYLKQRALDVEAELIVKERYGTIKTHLEHWLDFIGRDTKLKELERTDTHVDTQLAVICVKRPTFDTLSNSNVFTFACFCVCNAA